MLVLLNSLGGLSAYNVADALIGVIWYREFNEVDLFSILTNNHSVSLLVILFGRLSASGVADALIGVMWYHEFNEVDLFPFLTNNQMQCLCNS